MVPITHGKGFKSSIQQAYENSNVLFYMELQVQDPVVSDFRMVATGFREIVRVFSRVFGVPGRGSESGSRHFTLLGGRPHTSSFCLSSSIFGTIAILKKTKWERRVSKECKMQEKDAK